jgi:hypothetical protein
VRVAVLLTVAAALVLALAGYSLLGGKDSCELFGADLDLAVTEPAKAPDPDDHGSLEYGSCSLIATKRFDAHVLGYDRHSEHAVAGRVLVSGGDRQQLDAANAELREEPGVRITPLPKLGPGAFLVTRTQPETPPAQTIGVPSDPAGALSLPATAYWMNARYGSYSASATRDGATVEQSQRATERLAELVNRRPVKQAN